MATQTVKVAATSTVTTIATPIASIIEVSKTATPEIRSCNGSCDETFTLTATLMSGGALPGWITFSSTNRNVAVDPLTSAAIGVWNIKITQNTVSGFDPTTSAKPAFESLRLTVLCEVSAFANPAAPSLANRTYSIYDPTKSIDLAATFALQTPPCDYTPSYTYTWTIPSGAPIVVNSSKPSQIDIVSVLKSKVNTYSVTFTNTISNALGGVASATSTVTFDVVVIDPCNTAVITPPTIVGTFSVTNGQTGTFTFLEAVDSVATANAISTICGTRTYVMRNNDDTSTISWLAITGPVGGSYTVTATPDDDSLEG